MKPSGSRSDLVVAITLALALVGCDPQPSKEAPATAVSPPPAPSAQPATGAGGAAAARATTPAQAPNTTPDAQPEPRQVVLASGLSYRVLKPGTGSQPKLGAAVVYHWTGWLPNGREVWDTRRAGVPQRDVLSYTDLIPGLVNALLDMKVGERRELRIPSQLAYGDQGYEFVVPPRSELRVDVELVGVGP